MTEQSRIIDLRGSYRPQGQGRDILVLEPEDIVAHGLRVNEHAVVATPGWGEDGLARYKAAIFAAETEQRGR